ncbi:MAG: ADP-glyceromanno-heptose 6-epimerase, partial [Chitinophagia bacterium]|nr:ADP-glyceromanno-heptose 6-epimerase [Chitinophagia bacterium]
KVPNYEHKIYQQLVDREQLIEWLNAYEGEISHFIHLGARTDTTEMDYEVHKKWNLDYSKAVWEWCAARKVPLIYASSAATYGNGEHGYTDDHAIVTSLHPLNPYGVSKNEFDIWALQQASAPPFWAGLKFFNVYGPNEYHKARMASVIFHAYNQIQQKGSVKLFRSHNPNYKDGEQIRDFIYVKDIANFIAWLMEHRPESGLYNAGTGQARTFKDLVTAIFTTLGLPANIEFIDTPIDIRDKYQYFTEADMAKVRAAGYIQPFSSLEEGVGDYVSEYLTAGKYY